MSAKRLTVLPFTNAIRFPGGPGAVAAAELGVCWRWLTGQVGSVAADEKMPVMRAVLCVRQLQGTVRFAELADPIAVTDATGDDVEGVVGAWLPPQLVNVRRVATENPAVSARVLCIESFGSG